MPYPNNTWETATDLSGASGSIEQSWVYAELVPNVSGNYFSTSRRTLWWKWTAPTSGKVQFDTIGSPANPVTTNGLDTVVALYSSTDGGSTRSFLLENDDWGDSPLPYNSLAQFMATAGVTYYIQIHAYSGNGTLKLTWGEPTPLPDSPDGWQWNTYSDAWVFDAGPYIGGNIIWTTATYPTPGVDEYGIIVSDAVWDLRRGYAFSGNYVYVSETSQSTEPDFTEGASGIANPRLYLILWEEQYNEASRPPVPPTSLYSPQYAAGGTAPIRTDGPVVEPVANDNFSGAIPITGGAPITYANTGSTSESGEPGTAIKSIWFSYTFSSTEQQLIEIQQNGTTDSDFVQPQFYVGTSLATLVTFTGVVRTIRDSTTGKISYWIEGQPGQTIYMRLSFPNSAPGVWSTGTSSINPGVAPNDTQTSATKITPEPYIDGEGNALVGGVLTASWDANSRDEWFRVTVPVGGSMIAALGDHSQILPDDYPAVLVRIVAVANNDFTRTYGIASGGIPRGLPTPPPVEYTKRYPYASTSYIVNYKVDAIMNVEPGDYWIHVYRNDAPGYPLTSPLSLPLRWAIRTEITWGAYEEKIKAIYSGAGSSNWFNAPAGFRGHSVTAYQFMDSESGLGVDNYDDYRPTDIPCLMQKVRAGVARTGWKGHLTEGADSLGRIYRQDAWQHTHCAANAGRTETVPVTYTNYYSFYDKVGVHYQGPSQVTHWVIEEPSTIGGREFIENKLTMGYEQYAFMYTIDPNNPDHMTYFHNIAVSQANLGALSERTRVPFSYDMDVPASRLRLDLSMKLSGHVYAMPYFGLNTEDRVIDPPNRPRYKIRDGGVNTGENPNGMIVYKEVYSDGSFLYKLSGIAGETWPSDFSSKGPVIAEGDVQLAFDTEEQEAGQVDAFGQVSTEPVHVNREDYKPYVPNEWHTLTFTTDMQDGDRPYSGDHFKSQYSTHGVLINQASYTVTKTPALTYLGRPIRTGTAIGDLPPLEKIEIPMRQRHRDDGLATDAREFKGHASSQQISIRRGGRTYY